MSSMVGVVPTKSGYYTTYKDSAGNVGEVANEWVMNVTSATKKRGVPATGKASLEKIHGFDCLILDSHTCVGSGDAKSMSEMVAIGPSDGSKGIHNMKGHGTRLLLAKLGGVQFRAADLLAFTVDASTKSPSGAVLRVGPSVDKMHGDGGDMARAGADIKFGPTKLSFLCEGGDKSLAVFAEHILCRSSHPYQLMENDGETKSRLCQVADDCLALAASSDNQQKQFTRFIYFNLGHANTEDPKPLLEVRDGDLYCNDTDLPLEEYLREKYVPNDIGIYPLPGIDDRDYTGGKKKISVQDKEVFDKKSWLWDTHHETGVVRSESLIKIDCGNGREMQMLAYWPSPENARKGSDRYSLHDKEQFHTGTYLVYKDMIINPYDPKSLNTKYPGSEHFQRALMSIYSQNLSHAKASLVRNEDGPLKAWLGFNTWKEWTDAGFPAPADLKKSADFDKDRLYEMLTCGAVFIVRVDQVLGLDTRKDEVKEKQGLGLSIAECMYKIRRAEVRWCLDTKPKERVDKEARMAAALQRRGGAAGPSNAPLNLDPRSPSGRSRKQAIQYTPERSTPATNGRSSNKRQKKAPTRSPRAHKSDHALTALHNFLKQMAAKPTWTLCPSAKDKERDELITLWKKFNGESASDAGLNSAEVEEMD